MVLNNVVRKTLKVIAWIVAGIIGLLVLVFILIQIPAVQNFAKDKVVSYLQGKLKTKVAIGNLSIAFPKQIVLKNVFFADQRQDTLLSGKEIRVDIALLKLLSNEVNIRYMELDGIRANIYRVSPDTVFNYQYIVDAFMGQQKKPPQTDTTGTLKFHLDKIVLKDITSTFKDDETGNDVYFYLGNFETTIDKFDPDHLVYSVPSINIADVNTKIYQYKPIIQDSGASTPADTIAAPSTNYPSLTMRQINLRNINFNYRNDISALLADLHIGELVSHPQNINLQSMFIQLKDFQLKNTTAKIAMGSTTQAQQVKDTVATKTKQQLSNPWKVVLEKVDFSNDALVYDDNSKPRMRDALDFSHLDIRGFVLNADSLTFTPSEYAGTVNQLTFEDQSGFAVRKFHTRFLYNDRQTALNDLLLQTNNSYIGDNITLSYPSVASMTKRPGEIFIDARLPNVRIGVQDLLLLIPSYRRSMQGYEHAVIRVNTRVKGYVSDLSIPTFELSGFGRTYVKLSGTIKGLPDTKQTFYNVKIDRLSSTRSDIVSLLPPNSLPSNFRLPGRLSLTGYLKGSMNAFNTQLALRTDKGNVDLKGTMNTKEVYSLKTTLTNVDIGYLTKQDSAAGPVTLTATVNGAGLDPKTASAQYTVDIESAEWNGYTYHNAVLNGNTDHGNVHTTARIDDPNIKLNLDATADIKPAYPSVGLNLLVDTLNLSALKLVTDSLTTLRGQIVANMQNTNPDSLNGTVNINQLVMHRGGQVITEDSLSLVATAAGQQKSIVINSDALKADLTGEYRLTEFAQALQQTVNRYYHLPGFKEQRIAAENWQLNATIIPTGIVLQLMPGLTGSDSTVISSAFNSEANDLRLQMKNNRLVYNGQQLDSLNVTAQTAPDRLNFAASIQQLRSPSNHLYHTAVTGFVANNQVGFGLDVKDRKNTSQYALSGLLSQIAHGVQLSLRPDSLILDYTHWTVSGDNYIQYDTTAGFLVHNFGMSHGAQALRVNSTEDKMNAPVRIDFKDFQISTLTRLANQDTALVSGVINGNAIITDALKNPVFTSDLRITNLMYQQDSIGDMAIKVNNRQANAFAADVALTGHDNDVRLNGTYYTGEGRMNLQLDLNQLNLAILKGLSAGQLNDVTGYLKGNVSIAGTAAQPAVNGSLHFENASITPAATGERFTLPDDAINVDGRGVHFNQFTLVDSSGNKAILNGDVATTDFKNYAFNLDLNADNFTVVNTAKTTNQLFYGKLNIDTRIKMRGDMASPTVNAYLRVNKATDFALVLPSTDPEVVSREGVVKFVDKDHPSDSVHQESDLDTASINTSKLRGLDVSATIETDTSAKFTLVIDERNGDALTLQGKADLTGGIDKSGKISLAGTEELISGSYQISLSFLQRKFDIQRGSTITWTGDPTSANINVTATYIANTASIDLVEQQLAGRTDAEINRFKQKLPFHVNLIMTGELLKPVVAFDITLPQEVLSQWPEVDQRLAQIRAEESELNKQVFALLLLGRFVGENPLQSAAGGTSTGAMVRQSASRLLTDQLNQLAGNLIQGVDINFNLTSETDYSTGQAANLTQLNVGVSKTLMNDRLRVNVGSNFELEGPQNSNRSASNLAGDVSVDYELTKDGRYMIRIYRRNQYQGVIEGQVIETGASFMLTFDYDKLRELFMSKQQKKEVKEVPLSNKQAAR